MKTLCKVLVILLALGFAFPAEAGKKQAQKKEAKKMFMQGEMHYKLGRFKEALAAYSKAYEVLPLAGFLFNIGQCHRKLGSWERAAFFYRGYLREKPRAPNRKVVEGLIVECQSKMSAQEKQRLADAERKRQDEARKQRERQLTMEKDKADAEANAAAEKTKTAQARAAAEAAEAARRAAEIKPPPETPVYKQWWLWTVVGVVVAGAAATTAILLTQDPDPVNPAGSLGTVDWEAARF